MKKIDRERYSDIEIDIERYCAIKFLQEQSAELIISITQMNVNR